MFMPEKTCCGIGKKVLTLCTFMSLIILKRYILEVEVNIKYVIENKWR